MRTLIFNAISIKIRANWPHQRIEYLWMCRNVNKWSARFGENFEIHYETSSNKPKLNDNKLNLCNKLKRNIASRKETREKVASD